MSCVMQLRDAAIDSSTGRLRRAGANAGSSAVGGLVESVYGAMDRVRTAAASIRPRTNERDS